MTPPPDARPWYVRAFAGDYLQRYKHRDEAQAERETPFLLEQLALDRGARVLDLCCGAGRHACALTRAGLQVAGVDLSRELLARARAEHVRPRFVRADMCALPFRAGSFDGAINLFTSFGYFERETDDTRALAEAARVLRRGAVFVQDFFNLPVTLDELVPESCARGPDGEVLESRSYDAQRKRLEKRVCIRRGDERDEICESVRAYTPDELTGLFEAAGLRVVARFGSLQGEAFDPAASRRCVTIGRRA